MKYQLLIILALCLSGCAKLQHLDQLLTLKAFGENQEEIAQHIAERDAQYDRLLEAVNSSDGLKEYANATAVSQAFGEPTITKEITVEGQPRQRWLYRPTAKLFRSPKVYLYFDEQEKLLAWEYLPEG